jgi:hypothetical protein
MLYNKGKAVTKIRRAGRNLWDAPNQSVAIDAAPDIQGISLQRIVSEMQGNDYQNRL